MNNYKKTLIIITAILILGMTTITSYAYFVASLIGNDSAYDTVITSGEMALMLNDGEQVGLNNAIPGDSVTKEFSVKNTGTVETTYNAYFSELLNQFEDKNDLVYTLTSENGCPNSNETVVPSEVGEQSKLISNCTIKPNQIHNYQLTITFKNDNTNQDDNKGKKFSAKISINEYDEFGYFITFDSNGGNSENITIKTNSLYKIESTPIPKKTIPNTFVKYQFLGWYDSIEGGNLYDENSIYDGDKTLYAHWRIYNYLADSIKSTGSDKGVYNDLTRDENVRFLGASPNNYIKIPNVNTRQLELWRIIGVFNKETHGYDGNLVKVVKDEPIGIYQYNTINDANWEQSNALKEINKQYQIAPFFKEVEWKLGAAQWNSDTTGYSLYNDERSEKLPVYNPTQYQTSWKGKMGLMYASDIAMTSKNCWGSDKLNRNNWIVDFNDDNNCARNSWFLNNTITNIIFSATLTTVANQGNCKIFTVPSRNGTPFAVISANNNLSISIYPSAYLMAGLSCGNCNDSNVGTIDNPYSISLSSGVNE